MKPDLWKSSAISQYGGQILKYQWKPVNIIIVILDFT